MGAQVIDLFGRKSQPETALSVDERASSYARTASALADECERQDMDPEILAASIMAVVIARRATV